MSNETPSSPHGDEDTSPVSSESTAGGPSTQQAAAEDTFTGEVDVPAAPRPASGHVNTGQSATVSDAEAADADARPAEPEPAEPVAAERKPVEPEPAEPAAAEHNATEADAVGAPPAAGAHPVTAVYDDDTAPTSTVQRGWAPEPEQAPVAAEAMAAQPAPSVAPQSEPAAAQPEPAAQPGPIYLTAPTPPKAKGNRAAGILISIVAAIAFAVINGLVVFGIFALAKQSTAVDDLVRYIATPAYWGTAIIFALAMFLLAAIANRGGWWWYVLGGFLVGVVVYFAYIGTTLLTNAGDLSPNQVSGFVAQLWSHPLTFAAAVVAREVAVWFGAWIAARGRTVTKRNLEQRREFDASLAENPPRYPTA